MKKIVPFVALFSLIACNNETPAALPTVVNSADNKDSAALATSDSLSIQAATEVAEVSKELRPPPPPTFVPKPAQSNSQKKTDAKPKAKIDSIAIREAKKLPLDQ